MMSNDAHIYPSYMSHMAHTHLTLHMGSEFEHNLTQLFYTISIPAKNKFF